MKKASLKNGLKIALVAGGVMALVPAVYGQGIGLQTLERMTAGTPQQIDRGAQVFDDQCATCHGDEGRGGAELGQRLGAQGFVGVEVERSGLYSIYDVVARGYEYDEDQEHPVFENLFYQDQWAVAHYVHGLIDDPQPDPPELVERIRREAVEGICFPEIRAEISAWAEPEDEEQIALGGQLYQQRCSVCHGDEGRGDGPGAGTDPPARDLAAPIEEWTVGTSPSALYTVLDQGIDGTAMAAFGHLPEEELWAMVHFMREEFIPTEIQEDMTEEEIDEVCRAMSSPPRPDPLPIERAMEFLAADADEERFLRYQQYGTPLVYSGADESRGAQIFDMKCASCHGADGQAGAPLGPYGSFPPYLRFELEPLEPAAVGGTYVNVAERVIAGAHATIPDMTPVATFTRKDWQDVQAYLSTLEGAGSERVRTVDFATIDAEQLLTFERTDALRIVEAIDDTERAGKLMQFLDELADQELEETELDDEELDDELSEDLDTEPADPESPPAEPPAPQPEPQESPEVEQPLDDDQPEEQQENDDEQEQPQE